MTTHSSRRGFLGGLATGAAALHVSALRFPAGGTSASGVPADGVPADGVPADGVPADGVPGIFAEQLTRTPRQTEGPFYPKKLPLDTDNDLLIINDHITSAVGAVTHLTGRVLTESGAPLRNVVVEIWQVDHNGVYLHPGSAKGEKRDGNFQGFGRFLTGLNGEYYFRTVKPVPYPGRTPHIHFKIKRGDRELLTTQCYVRGHPGNARDGVLRSIRDAKQRAAVQVPFAKLADSEIGELHAHFDVVLGVEKPSK